MNREARVLLVRELRKKKQSEAPKKQLELHLKELHRAAKKAKQFEGFISL